MGRDDDQGRVGNAKGGEFDPRAERSSTNEARLRRDKHTAVRGILPATGPVDP